MFGTNIIVKPSYTLLGKLSVHSIFKTIQGEGPFAGTPALFVRLQNCNLACPVCDTQFDKGNVFEIQELVEVLKGQVPATLEFFRPLIVITGGEPFIQPDLPDLCKLLIQDGFRIQIETAGTVWQKPFGNLFVDYFYRNHLTIVCSPKTGKLNKNLARWIYAYKYVLRFGKVSDTDGLPIEFMSTGKKGTVARYYDYDSFYSNLGIQNIFIMPCDEHNQNLNDLNQKLVIRIAQDYGYRICLQVHKILDVV